MRPRSRFTAHQSKRFSERKQARTVMAVGLTIVCLVTWVFSMSRLSRLPLVTIQSVHIYGADQDISQSLSDAALSTLDGDYVGLFSRANSFLYSKAAVRQAVMNASPRIGSVSVAREDLRNLAVTVTEKTPAALICTSLPDFTANTLSFGENDSCYFSDKTGTIFADAPSFSGRVYKRYYVPNLSDDVSSSTSLIGSSATTSAEFQALQDFYDRVDAAGLEPAALLMKDGGEYELYVHNPSADALSSTTDSNMAVVYFNNARPFDDELVNLVSFWKKMLDDARAKRERLAFDYIDVRYGSNVYFRMMPQ